MNLFNTSQWIEALLVGEEQNIDMYIFKNTMAFEDSKISAELLQLMNLYIADKDIFDKTIVTIRNIRASANENLLQDNFSNPLLLVQSELAKKTNIIPQVNLSRRECPTREDWVESLIESKDINLKSHEELSIAYYGKKLTLEQIYNENYLLQVTSDKTRFVARTLLGNSKWHLEVANLIMQANIDVIYTLRQVRQAKTCTDLAIFLTDDNEPIRQEAERIAKSLS